MPFPVGQRSLTCSLQAVGVPSGFSNSNNGQSWSWLKKFSNLAIGA